MPEAQSWTWVRDVDTGHCYDVPTVSLERAGGSLPGMQVLAAKPVHWGIRPRRAKHRTDLAGEPATPNSSAAPADKDAASAAQTEE